MNGTQTPTLSIVSPVYRAAEIVEELVRRIQAAAIETKLSFEIILVEDAGPDNSWEKIRSLTRRYPELRGLRLSRNFGQHRALTAALEAARGTYVVVMDCDLQDDPALIPSLVVKAKEGNDIVYTRKLARKHGPWKNFTAAIYRKVFRFLVGSDSQAYDPAIGNFSVLHRRVVDAFLSTQEVHRHYLMILRWLGFPATIVTIPHLERPSGRSSWSLEKLFAHAVDGIVSQSTRVLNFAVALGFLSCLASVALAAYLIGGYLYTSRLPGWTSTIVVILLGTGLILMSIGVVGVYLGKVFEQVKGRPLYVVQERIEFGHADQLES